MDAPPDDDPRLDSALELAFGASTEAPPPRSPGDLLGRFEPTGELGRGGLAIVYAARDPILDREVAVKVLRPDRADDPGDVARLVEEARVGARLEHPGVIPVHELGVGSDGRPFFAMQLVRGRSFAEVLAARSSTLDGLGGHLSTLLAIAQTVAYAHAQGVVHRDLKPANVIVGEFGEVRVADWGLAKTLARPPAPEGPASPTEPAVWSATCAPHGTPRYMPPEQARGRARDVDARSDVFALGGMLAEILTGQPPYEGETPLADAAEARLDGARARLRDAPCDSALRLLALDALEPEMSLRPSDGRVFARRLEEHLAFVAARARRAEIDDAEARVRALAERRRRRLVRLAASGAVLVALGAVVVWRGRAEEIAARARRIDARVDAALLAAGEARGRAIEAGDAARWELALEAARGSRRLADDTDAPPEARLRADAAVALAERGGRDAADVEARRRTDRALLDELSALDVGLSDGEDGRLDAVVSDRRLTELFRRAGFDGTGSPSPKLAELVERAGTGARLAVGLAVWARFRRAAGGDAEPVLRLADDADPDPLRVRLRRGVGVEDLVRDLDALEPARTPTESLVAAAVFLVDTARDPSRARRFTDAAVARDPQVFAAQHAAVAARLGVDDLDGALAAASAGVALRPTSAPAWVNLARVRSRRGEVQTAYEAGRRALELRPSSIRVRFDLAVYAAAVGEGRRGALVALPAHDERVAEIPTSAFARLQRGKCLGVLGRLADARADFEEALRLRPDYAAVYGRLSRALLGLRDLDGAVRWATAARDALATDPSSHEWLGEVLLEVGRYDDAIAAFEVSAARNDRSVPEFNARLDAMTSEAKRRRAADARVDEALASTVQSRDDDLSLAAVLLARGRASDAVVVHRRILDRLEADADPVVAADLRTRAAITAAVDAASESKTCTASRKFAIICLRATLDAVALPRGAPRPGSGFDVLASWGAEPRFASIREATQLARLSDEERAACVALWRDADAILSEEDELPPTGRHGPR